MTRYILINLLSITSMLILFFTGTQYLIFVNTPVYENYSIEIINNPVSGNEDIQFAMVGTKRLDCTANDVYGVAYGDNHEVLLDQFTKAYVRGVNPGETVTNSWALAKPSSLTKGIYHVTMYGTWDCRFWIFKETSLKSYENILLVVE